MNVQDYEAVVRRTNNYGRTREDFLDMSVALAGEVGEFCNLAKKLMYVPQTAQNDADGLRALHLELGDAQFGIADAVREVVTQCARDGSQKGLGVV